MSNIPAATEPSATSAQGLNAWKPRISHVAYHVADIDRALAFYVGCLGLKEQMRVPLGKNLYEVVLGFPESKGGGLILMWSTERNTPYPLGEGYSRFVLTVSDVDAAVAHVAKHGAPIVQPAKDAGPMRYAMVKDPDGYVIELLQLKRG